MSARTRSFQHVLIPLIVGLSKADNWAKAKYEWDYTKYDHISLHEDFACLCGYQPIAHLHTITNRLNGNEAVIGSCCIQQFMGLADLELKGLARVRADLGKALNPKAVKLAFGQGWITLWERGFCLDTQRKRNLSAKQEAKRREINKLVLARLAPVMETKEAVQGGK